MAYVVARPAGRFEIRESVHTTKGPRARSLANFGILTDQVLAVAAGRAERPFDARAVLASAHRVGAPLTTMEAQVDQQVVAVVADGSHRHFVETSRRMAQALEQPSTNKRPDPGPALIDLLGFTDAILRSQPPRPFESLGFPVLSRIAEQRSVGASPG
jgi:hypothetical protein